MLNALYLTAERIGIEILYDAEVVELDIQDGMFLSAKVAYGNREFDVHAAALVAASGGFEANIEWLKQYWGDVADNFLIRGTPNNRGTVLKMLLDPMGGIVLTNDGHAILREIEVSHPAAKSMIELSRTQDEEVGDGTTTVIILGAFAFASTTLK